MQGAFSGASATPQPSGGTNPLSFLGIGASTASGASSLAGGASFGSSFSPLLFAELIGLGKNIESSNANTPVGQGFLAGLAPSGSQIAADPLGMGLPTLLGAPFLTPFTSSAKAQATKPEWQSLFSLGSNF